MRESFPSGLRGMIYRIACTVFLWMALPAADAATPPEPPTGFRARGLTQEEVLLWWRDDVQGAQRLRVEIEEGPLWKRVAELPPSAIVYSVHGLTPASQYRFRLGAVSEDGTVAWTQPQEAATFPSLYRGNHQVARPDGDDTAAGTAEAPFRMIRRAAAASPAAS